MGPLLIRSKERPTLFVKKVMPNAYRFTPVQWGSRSEAKQFDTYDRAESIQDELHVNNIETELIQNGDELNGRTSSKF